MSACLVQDHSRVADQVAGVRSSREKSCISRLITNQEGCVRKQNSQIGSREGSASDFLQSKHPFADHKYSFWQHHFHLSPLNLKPVHTQVLHSPVATTRPLASRDRPSQNMSCCRVSRSQHLFALGHKNTSHTSVFETFRWETVPVAMSYVAVSVFLPRLPAKVLAAHDDHTRIFPVL